MDPAAAAYSPTSPAATPSVPPPGSLELTLAGDMSRGVEFSGVVYALYWSLDAVVVLFWLAPSESVMCGPGRSLLLVWAFRVKFLGIS